VLPLLLIALVIVPIVELYVIIQVGQAFGVVETLVLLVVMSILGGVLLRAQGRAAWLAFTEALRSSRIPAREVIDGALIILGGALLLTPGFLTDAVGILLLLPPTRATVRRVFVARFALRFMPGGPVAAGVAGVAARRARARSAERRDGRPADVEGSAEELPRTPPRGDERP
jgi:UPF0716 protein FxsA